MSAEGRALCRDDALAEGESLTFRVSRDGHAVPAFVLRHQGRLFAYLNACPHLGAPLDWVEGRFLDAKGERILCANHAARFRIEDGFCVIGPCRGQSLERLALRLAGGQVFLAVDRLADPSEPRGI